jgi:glycosyltransferase 2 family protein
MRPEPPAADAHAVPTRPRTARSKRQRWLRVGATLVLTALAVGYLVWKIDVRKSFDTLVDANPWWFLLACAIMVGTALPMALRWQWLLAAQRIDETFAWLTRAYFVSFTASQILPTSIGGDAMRIYETSRRHPGRTGDIAAIVLLERGVGGAGTVLLGAIGFVLAIGHYDVGAYLWLESAFVLGTAVLIFVFFARSARPLLTRGRAPLTRLRIERPLRAFYDGVHHFRDHVGLVWKVFVFTTVIQAVRILSIWACARSVGIELGPRIYYVMGPLFFLVLLVPFTINGFAVREAFFVSFLGSVGIAADPAFAAGFLFFLLTVTLALPGAAVLLWENLRGGRRASRIERW